MFPSSDMAEAFIDWLERDGIQRALIVARPALEDSMVLEDGRPMIRIPSPTGGLIVVAKTAEGTMTQWVVGIPSRPEPSLHEPESHDEIVRIVLEALDEPTGHTHQAPGLDGTKTPGWSAPDDLS